MIPSGYPDQLPDLAAYPREAGSCYVIELAGSLNGRDGEFEGPLPHAIGRYRRYELRDVTLAELLAEDHAHSPGLAAGYAAMDPSTRPPGIYDPGRRELLDGNHRARAALLNGEAAMACYVGVAGSEDPFWDEWQDEG